VERYEKSDLAYEKWRLLCCEEFTHIEWMAFPQHATLMSFAVSRCCTPPPSDDVAGERGPVPQRPALRGRLEALKQLRFIDLSHNADLNVKATLQQLSDLRTLEHVACLPSESVHRADTSSGCSQRCSRPMSG